MYCVQVLQLTFDRRRDEPGLEVAHTFTRTICDQKLPVAIARAQDSDY